VSVARWILGEPVEVLARARFDQGVDMTTSALLGFDGGPTASVFASFESAQHQEVTVIGRGDVRRLERPFNRLVDPIEPYRLMVESFADSILEARPAEIPLSESIANMRTLDRIRAAFRP
jgi:predicted dehydrogenase